MFSIIYCGVRGQFCQSHNWNDLILLMYCNVTHSQLCNSRSRKINEDVITNLEALRAFTRTSYRKTKSYFTSKKQTYKQTKKRIGRFWQIIVTLRYLLFKLLRWLCMLFASSSKLCLLRFLIFFQHLRCSSQFFCKHFRVWLIYYLARATMNFALRVPETIDIFMYERNG